ncbi:uncharacterized protein LOC112892454 [Panicum hallii]|uniref:uncharacterized protein LOC112892454 n=1 Tax=Panicum hallii TaxID=206008 RepID=UPI000DF4D808|nr:uncharacterized protein LOC112892454 [Panicum hallii]
MPRALAYSRKCLLVFPQRYFISFSNPPEPSPSSSYLNQLKGAAACVAGNAQPSLGSEGTAARVSPASPPPPAANGRRSSSPLRLPSLSSGCSSCLLSTCAFSVILLDLKFHLIFGVSDWRSCLSRSSGWDRVLQCSLQGVPSGTASPSFFDPITDASRGHHSPYPLQLPLSVALVYCSSSPRAPAALAICCTHIDKFLSSSFPVKDPLDRNQTSINQACPCNSAPKSGFNSLLVFIPISLLFCSFHSASSMSQL